MKRTTKLLAGVFTTLALTVGLAATTPATSGAVGGTGSPRGYPAYSPDAVPSAYPGQFIDFTGDMTPHPTVAGTYKYMGFFCTLGAVGTDAAGRKIGITAGHCNQAPQWVPDPDHPGELKPPGQVLNNVSYPDYPKYPGAPLGVPVTNNNFPVFDVNAVKWAQDHNLPPVSPIGWIRWVNKDTFQSDGITLNLNTTTDYMIIEFAPEVQLSSQVRDKDGNNVHQSGGGLFKVNSIYGNASGTPALPPVSSVFNTSTWIENYGARSDRTPDINSVGLNRGAIGIVANGMIRSYAASQGGDSGGPVVMNGTGKWVGITAGSQIGLNSPYYTTSAKNILDNLNGPLVPAGTAGKGFTITNN